MDQGRALVLLALLVFATGCLQGNGPPEGSDEPRLDIRNATAYPGGCLSHPKQDSACLVIDVSAPVPGDAAKNLTRADWTLDNTTGPVHQPLDVDISSTSNRTEARLSFHIEEATLPEIRQLHLVVRPPAGPNLTHPIESVTIETPTEASLLDLNITEVEPGPTCDDETTDGSTHCHTVQAKVENRHPVFSFDEIGIEWGGEDSAGQSQTPTTSEVASFPYEDNVWEVTLQYHIPQGRTLDAVYVKPEWASSWISNPVPEYQPAQDDDSASNGETETGDEGSDGAQAEPTSETQDYQDVTLDFEWEFEGREWTWSFELNESIYEAYSSVNRSRYQYQYSAFVLEPNDDVFIEGMASRLERAAEEEGYSEVQTINFVLRFVQSLPYAYDNVTTPFDDYPRYPIETLAAPAIGGERGVDCEDTSILFASLIRELGYGVILIGPPRHMAVGVAGEGGYGEGWHWEYQGRKYFFAETTGSGWDLGDMPDTYEGEEAQLYSLASTPILTRPNWTTESDGQTLEVTVSTVNVGSESATDLTMYVAFDAEEEGKIWSEDWCEAASVPANEGYRCILRIETPPEGERTRLQVYAWAENAPRKDSFSGWFEV